MIITVASQKGGTGKTTTAAALATWGTIHGMKALAIDADPQGSLTFILRGNGNAAGTYELMKGTPAQEIIQTGTPAIIPAGLQLAGADAELASRPGRDFLLKRGLEPIKGQYDLIVIDTPPTLGTILINALTASDAVLIPVQADTFALQSLFQLMDTIAQVRTYCNNDLDVAGVFLTRYSWRTVLARDMTAAIKDRCQQMGITMLTTAIREGVAVKEAQTMQQSIFEYAPRSKPAQDYDALAREIFS